MMALVVTARQGRQLQRYSKAGGGRLVVGCIPYKLKFDRTADNGGIEQSLEVLVISSQKGNAILFPKGGWETDESMKEAACREALEEAGVRGDIEGMLGSWRYKSRSHDAVYEGTMFPLHVTDELANWPEKDTRQRRWVSVAEANERCPHSWMTEALDRLVRRLNRSLMQKRLQNSSI